MDQTTIDMLIAGIQSHNWLLVVAAGLFIIGSVVVSVTHALGKKVIILDSIVDSLKQFLSSKKEASTSSPTTPAESATPDTNSQKK